MIIVLFGMEWYSLWVGFESRFLQGGLKDSFSSVPITAVSPLVQVGSREVNNYVKGAPLTFEEGF